MDQRPDDFQPPRLSATIASQRLLVLDFVRRYIARWGYSPSQGEIAAELQVHRDRVRRAIRSLARDGLLLRKPGSRGLAIPSAEAEALRQLRALGWVVNPDGERALKAPLLPPAALDYSGPHEEDGTDGGTRDGSGHTAEKGA